jgi:tyrosyl-tRNA synthetase
MCSPFDFWQYWRNTQDNDVIRFFKLFTDLSLSEIETLSLRAEKEINEVKKILADEITKIAHGQQAAQESRATAESLFEGNAKGYTLKEGVLETSMPVIPLNTKEHRILDLMVSSGLGESNSQCRRLISGNGVKINDQIIADDTYITRPLDFNDDGVLKLSCGKKKHVLFFIETT